MNAVAEKTFRGVECRKCGKPIRLSNSLLKRMDSNRELAPKTFAARCKRCAQEGLYVVKEIVEFRQD